MAALSMIHIWYILGDPEVTANIYCKSRNLPNTDTSGPPSAWIEANMNHGLMHILPSKTLSDIFCFEAYSVLYDAQYSNEQDFFDIQY